MRHSSCRCWHLTSRAGVRRLHGRRDKRGAAPEAASTDTASTSSPRTWRRLTLVSTSRRCKAPRGSPGAFARLPYEIFERPTYRCPRRRTRPAEQPLLRGANRRDLRVAWDRTGRARRPRWSASRDSASGWWRDRSARTRPASGTRTGAADDQQPLATRRCRSGARFGRRCAVSLSLRRGALGATACRLGARVAPQCSVRRSPAASSRHSWR